MNGTTMAPVSSNNTMAPTSNSTKVPTAAPVAPTAYVPSGLVGNTYKSQLYPVLAAPIGFVGPCYKQYEFTSVGFTATYMCKDVDKSVGSLMDDDDDSEQPGRRMLQTIGNNTNMTTMAPTPASNGTGMNTSAPTMSFVPVWTLQVTNKVLSCGQNVQVGMIVGVMGGPATIKEYVLATDKGNHDHAPVVVCAEYTSVSQIWAGINAPGALLTMDFWVQPQPQNSSSSSVSCATTKPAMSQLAKYPFDHVVYDASDAGFCVSGSCKTSPYTILTCWSGGNQVWFDQGVGLSVGGVGLILTTMVAIGLAGRYTVPN